MLHNEDQTGEPMDNLMSSPAVFPMLNWALLAQIQTEVIALSGDEEDEGLVFPAPGILFDQWKKNTHIVSVFFFSMEKKAAERTILITKISWED